MTDPSLPTAAVARPARGLSRRVQVIAAAMVVVLLSGVVAAVPAHAAPGGKKKSHGDGPARCRSFVDSATYLLDDINRIIGADTLHRRGVDGAGVDIAVIDTGVMEVGGLQGQVVEGVDLSFDHVHDDLRGADVHGHGTAMASIIASRGAYGGDGVAPGSRVVDVKVGAADGSVDVSQVIAGIDWVVANKDTDGRNIRVLSLSYNTDSIQPAAKDPLSKAVENAWHNGIVVVVAGGNDGRNIHRLGNPATNPYVMAVGAAEMKGNWRVASWSSSGDGMRDPDMVAPGSQVLSHAVPGSYLASTHSQATCTSGGDTFLRGSGTSQAAAVVAGASALLLQERPELTPDQVKHLLRSGAVDLWDKPDRQGAGGVAVDLASRRPTPGAEAVQTHRRSTGLGSLEKARGSAHVVIDDQRLEGERTAFGTAWDPEAWAAASEAGRAWTGDLVDGDVDWLGVTWSGVTWSGVTWSGVTWSGVTWSGVTWSGVTWSGVTWSGVTWSGVTWSGVGWTSASWTGASWT